MNPFSEALIREQAKKDGISHISTGIAAVRNGKVLIVRRAAADFLGGSYELPGGGVDEGETIVDGAIRELKEETGLTVTKVVSAFAGFDYSTDRKPHVRQINYLVEVEDGEIVLDPNEHDVYRWVGEGDYDDIPKSDSMSACISEALKLARRHLYLFTLEVAPMKVGETYNPLPSHLTLMSRFWSELTPEELTQKVQPVFDSAAAIELKFGEDTTIGPKAATVHLVENTPELHGLHMQLLNVLNSEQVEYTEPAYVGEGHIPHVTWRADEDFAKGHTHTARTAYLIEVKIDGDKHQRFIRSKFELTSNQ